MERDENKEGEGEEGEHSLQKEPGGRGINWEKQNCRVTMMRYRRWRERNDRLKGKVNLY